MFDVDVLVVLVDGLAEPPGLAPRFPGLVNLQLHTQVPGAVPVENGHGLVAVVVDAGAHLAVAGIAVGVLLVVVPVHVQGLVGSQEGPAAVAVGVAALVAVLAEGVALAALVLVCPDPPPAVPAEDGVFRQTVRAQGLAVELRSIRQGVFPSTVGTGEGLRYIGVGSLSVHGSFLRSCDSWNSYISSFTVMIYDPIFQLGRSG